MKHNIKKKIVIILSLCVALLISPKVKSETNDISFKSNNKIYYSEYSNGNVYISTIGNIKNIYDFDSNDVYIIDQRYIKNSNMEVIDSYKIQSKKEMEEIINILLEYEKLYPSKWDRSFNSLLNEWQVHNICYFFNYDEESTQHVDLDNEDENKYNSNILSRILGNK